MTFLIIITAFVAVSPVYAHANLVQSDPPPNSVLPTSPSLVRLVFTEDVEPRFSEAAVYDNVGKRADNGFSLTSENHKVMVVALPELHAGIYTVSWRTISAVDGHVVSGSFPFGVGAVEIRNEPATASNASWGLGSLAEVIVYWINFVSQTFVVGGAIFVLLVWLPITKSSLILGELEKIARKGLSRIASVSKIVLSLALFATILSLIVQANYVAGSVSFQKLGMSAYDILSSTRFGAVWIFRIIVILTLFYLVRRVCESYRSKANWFLMLVAGGGLLLTTSLSSHAANGPSSGLECLL